MDYLHVKNHEITSEAHLERHILNNWKQFFDFDYFAKRLKISKRSIVDLIGKEGYCIYLIELKYRPIRKRDILQLERYGRDFKKLKGTGLFLIRGILVDYNHYTKEIRKCHIKT